MVGESLSKNMIAMGDAVLRRLDRSGFRVPVALWLYKSGPVGWHFVIASASVGRLGPLWAYRKIGAAIRSIESSSEVFTVHNVTATTNTDPLIVTLRKAQTTGPRMDGVRLTQQAVNGHFIEDAYIYRVQ